MSRVITFSRVFPSYHPRAGEPTDFVAKIWESIYLDNPEWLGEHIERVRPFYPAIGLHGVLPPKHHTIRAGHRFKVGDWFKPVVWGDDVNQKSGRKGPYQSKQITFAPDIQVKKTWDFEMDTLGVCAIAPTGEQVIYTFEYDEQWPESLDNEIAKNDGLSPEDFYWWFSRSPEFRKNDGFYGQIICWNDSLNY